MPYSKKLFVAAASIVLSGLISGCNNTKEITTSKPEVFKPEMTIALQGSAEKSSELFFQKTRNLKFYTNAAQDVKNEWVDVQVRRSNGNGSVTYQVMANVVTQKEFNGYGDDKKGVVNITFSKANDFCNVKQQAQLMSPYVFDAAREQTRIYKPIWPVTHEIIAPYDEDNDEEYAYPGDNIAVNEESDSSFIIMKWDEEKYYSVSNTYISPKASFRCMRRK